MFEAVHGSAPDIAGKNLANPIALVFSAAMMLRYLGETDAARRIEQATLGVLESGEGLTPDLGGSGTTTSVRDAIVTRLN
jgi:isocitrate dehydrogenase (NAD+)